MAKLKRWSNSALIKLQQCGEAFRRRYIEGVRGPSTLNLTRGSVVHRVAADANRAKLAGSTMSQEEAVDLAATEFDRRITTEGVELTPAEKPDGAKATGRAKDFAVAASRFYVKSVGPKVNPVAVERKIELRPASMNIVIAGVIDLLDDQGEIGIGIRDLKTSAKSPPRDDADKSQQLSMYDMLHLAKTGEHAAFLQLDHLVRTPERGWMSYVSQQTQRDDRDTEALANVLNAGVQAVERGVFMPNTQGWWCDARYCEFWWTCPYVSGRRTAAAKEED